MKKTVLLMLFTFMLAACASLQQSHMDWIAIGPEFPAKKDPSEVEIFTNVQEITHPYANLGLLRVKDLSTDRDTLKRGVEQARRFVASKGADAMILAQYNNAVDGSPNPTVILIVYAYKYGDNLTPADLKTMSNFEIESALNNSYSY